MPSVNTPVSQVARPGAKRRGGALRDSDSTAMIGNEPPSQAMIQSRASPPRHTFVVPACGTAASSVNQPSSIATGSLRPLAGDSAATSLLANVVIAAPSAACKVSAISILYLFSGERAAKPPGTSVAFWAGEIGKLIGVDIHVHEFDVLNGDDEDLADNTRWQQLCASILRKAYDALLSSPPCSTFGCRRRDRWGANPLRAGSGPELYGLKTLTAADKEKVQLGTLLATRSCEAMGLFIDMQLPCLNEQPANQEEADRAHMYKLECWRALLQRAEVKCQRLVQCMLGGEFTKPSDLVHFGVDLEDAPAKCTHPAIPWRLVPTGQTVVRPHPPLQGKLKAVRAADWTSSMRRAIPAANAPFLTKATASYPSGFNRYLAKKLIHAVLNRRRDQQKADVVEAQCRSQQPAVTQAGHGRINMDQGKLNFATPMSLANSCQPLDPADMAIGGLRNPYRSIEDSRSTVWAGSLIRQALSPLLCDNEDLMTACLQAVGNPDADAGPTLAHCEGGRQVMWEALRKHAPQACEGLVADEPDPDIPTPVFYTLLEAWRRAAQDPEAHVYDWLRQGAPAGISMDIPTCGIFPPARDTSEEHLDFSELQPCGSPDEFTNYAGIEDDPDAAEAIFKLRDARPSRVKEFRNWNQVVKYLGCTPVLSKVGIVKREIAGRVKKRVIVDSKESLLKYATNAPERTVLPRATDVVADALHQLAACDSSDSSVEWLVLDYSDAFFIVPSAKGERRYSVIKFRHRYYVFLVMVQGGRASPLIWARLAALNTRLTQGMFHPLQATMQTYVDDPCVTLSGNRFQRDLTVALIVYTWRCLGFPLSFAKGQRGSEVVWIGCSLRLEPSAVVASVKPETLEELGKQTEDLLSSNVCAIKAVMSYAGRSNHVASLLWAWRPFLQFIWAALRAGGSESSGAPPGCIWRKQIAITLYWLRAFMDKAAGTVIRRFDLHTYLNHGLKVELVLDASPWGLGGYIIVDGAPQAYFTSELTAHDERILGWPIGDCSGQQAWEALAALVALRLWHRMWADRRVLLRVAGDSVSMLTLVIHMRAPTQSKALGVIAREIALDVAHAVYQPDVATHIPGMANKVPDILSRRHQPGTSWQVPPFLAQVAATPAPIRDESYYNTLTPPDHQSEADEVFQ